MLINLAHTHRKISCNVYMLHIILYFSHQCYKHSCSLLLAAIKVFLTSMITVMGPTPPGTGVMYEATSFTASKSTSPTRREPEALVASERQQ